MTMQHRNFLGFTALLLAGSLVLTQCNSSNNTNTSANTTNPATSITDPALVPGAPVQLAVRPPFEGVNVPFQTYSVSAQKGGKLSIPTGTSIEIPANAFVDKDGKDVMGDVQIEYREFHTAADILASGIPMQNPETGEYMKTAGMFEIKGSQNGQEVFVKGGKEINIKMASFEDGTNYDFFQLNPKDCRWGVIEGQDSVPQINTEKANKMRALDKKIANMPVKPNKEGSTENFVFDFDVNYQRFPELKTFKNVVWEYMGTTEATNPEKQTWVFNVDWDKIAIEKDAKTQNFVITLETKGKKFSTEVRPVLSKEDYAKGMADFDKKMVEYAKVKVEVDKENLRLALQGDLLREFSIKGFGIFNCDIWKNPARTKCEPVFTFDNKAEINPEITQRIIYYLVTPSEQTVLQFGANNLSSFSWEARLDNLIVAVLPNNNVATFSVADFKKINVSMLDKGVKQTFPLKTSDIKIKSVADIMLIIDKLS